ncbi:SCP2 sterol-binding domain-containing protein [Nocardioides speluncae]|uniref:SCP2 sterol-binding domain-containing protein n=1 Tax=Nocardioides speluncae TaxID=2670337 RepID=UPI000D68FC66|nr:SCP2 sterol-binding domain-containing protein [Nocardioides speluncae]
MSALYETLRTATADEAQRFFADVDPVLLVIAVNETPDAELDQLIGRPEVRPAAVEGILGRLHEYAVPERLDEAVGVVRFDLSHDGALVERRALAFGGGRVRLVSDPEPADRADVVLSTTMLCFIRMIAGQRNAALEYLRGEVELDGDPLLVLGLGRVFRVPGEAAPGVGASALDPVDVAEALRQAEPSHLRRLMRGDFRPVVLREICRQLPDYYRPSLGPADRLAVGFRLTGPSDEVDRFAAIIEAGACTVVRGRYDGPLDATITCDGHDFLRLVTGALQPVEGTLRGKLTVAGDLSKALAFSGVMVPPLAQVRERAS